MRMRWPLRAREALLCRGLRRDGICKILRTEKKARCGEVGEE